MEPRSPSLDWPVLRFSADDRVPSGRNPVTVTTRARSDQGRYRRWAEPAGVPEAIGPPTPKRRHRRFGAGAGRLGQHNKKVGQTFVGPSLSERKPRRKTSFEKTGLTPRAVSRRFSANQRLVCHRWLIHVTGNVRDTTERRRFARAGVRPLRFHHAFSECDRVRRARARGPPSRSTAPGRDRNEL